MRATPCLTTLALFFTLLATMVPVSASRIPLGIRGDRGIFLQEVWQGDRPFLCVANRSEMARTLRVSRWMSRQIPAQPLLQWELDADSASCYDASALVGERLLAFELVDGKLLGLLRGPAMPNAQRPETSGVTSFLGPNGACPTPGVWIEQPTLWLRGGEPAILDLWIGDADRDAHIE